MFNETCTDKDVDDDYYLCPPPTRPRPRGHGHHAVWAFDREMPAERRAQAAPGPRVRVHQATVDIHQLTVAPLYTSSMSDENQ
jgi:hypothetical protein